jgi:hypothetical protein
MTRGVATDRAPSSCPSGPRRTTTAQPSRGPGKAPPPPPLPRAGHGSPGRSRPAGPREFTELRRDSWPTGESMPGMTRPDPASSPNSHATRGRPESRRQGRPAPAAMITDSPTHQVTDPTPPRPTHGPPPDSWPTEDSMPGQPGPRRNDHGQRAGRPGRGPTTPTLRMTDSPSRTCRVTLAHPDPRQVMGRPVPTPPVHAGVAAPPRTIR